MSSTPFDLNFLNEALFSKAFRDSIIHHSFDCSLAGELAGVSQISTDSRRIEKGSLFVALKGDQFDGHDYLESALLAGARGILIQKNAAIPPSVKKAIDERTLFAILATDTLDAFRLLGARWRKRFKGPLIAVAGSVGKTTTKELLAAILKGKYSHVLKTKGSQNGFIGIPLTLLELNDSHQAAVIEIGIDDKGAMIQHIPVVSPQISVVTKIGPEHLEKLENIETIAKEETLALQLVKDQPGGRIALNIDEPWLKPLTNEYDRTENVIYGFHPQSLQNAAYAWGKYDAINGNLSITTKSEKFTIRSPLPGIHNAGNLLSAVAVAICAGLQSSEIIEGLTHFEGAYGRSEIRELDDKTPAVCDYYNANPDSMRAGIALLCETATRYHCKKRFACIADMLELGSLEERYHRELADTICKENLEFVYLTGTRMKWLHDELKQREYTGSLHFFENKNDLSAHLIQNFQKGSALLIKGSRSMKMEVIFEAIQNHWSKNH